MGILSLGKNKIPTSIGLALTGIVGFLALVFISWRLFLFFVWQKPGEMTNINLKRPKKGPAWYKVVIEREEDVERPFLPAGYIRYPLLQAVNVIGPEESYRQGYSENKEKISRLVADSRESKIGRNDFRGVFYFLWTDNPVEKGTYRFNGLTFRVERLKDEDLVPFLEDSTYCERNGDCIKRDVEARCCTGVFNRYEQVQDTVQNCPPGTWRECRGGQTIDLGCSNCEVRYKRIECVDNRCQGFDREVVSYE